MKQKHNIIIRYTVGVLTVVVIAVAVVTVLIIKHSTVNAEATVKSKTKTSAIQSQFLFTGVSGWHLGPTNETSMALFSDDGECFTSIEHKPGIVDVATQIQKQHTALTTTGGTMTASATPIVSVQMSAGAKQYDLYEFSLSSNDTSHPLMGGLGLGYLQLPKGYLEIQSHCNTVSELPTTIPALQAYKFSPSIE